jgi:hypothetical protein
MACNPQGDASASLHCEPSWFCDSACTSPCCSRRRHRHLHLLLHKLQIPHELCPSASPCCVVLRQAARSIDRESTSTTPGSTLLNSRCVLLLSGVGCTGVAVVVSCGWWWRVLAVGAFFMHTWSFFHAHQWRIISGNLCQLWLCCRNETVFGWFRHRTISAGIFI